MKPRMALPLLLSLLTLAGNAVARDCAPGAQPALLATQFSSGIRANQPVDRLLYLAAGSRDLYVHARTRGVGKLVYRWLLDGSRSLEANTEVGAGEWNTWSHLRLPRPLPAEVRVEVRNGDGCVLRTLTLAASALADDAAASKAWQLLAVGDATGAKIELKLALENLPPRSAQARAAQRMLDVQVAIGEAEQRARAGDLFLVEPTLRQVEQRLDNRAGDRAARDWIATVRAETQRQRERLAHEGNYIAVALQHLLATEKLVTGDYPLLREDAERVVAPALQYAGDHYGMVDWQPTLRGYRLRVQDKRTGDTLEVSPD